MLRILLPAAVILLEACNTTTSPSPQLAVEPIPAEHIAECEKLVHEDIAAGIDTGGITPQSCTTDPRLSPAAIDECTRRVQTPPLPNGIVSITCLENGKIWGFNTNFNAVVSALPYWAGSTQ